MRNDPLSARRFGAPRFHVSRFLGIWQAALLLAFLCGWCATAVGADKSTAKLPSVRWDERTAGCTFTRGDDGKYRYGLWSGDIGVTLAVDSQELEKVKRRHEPFFSVLVEVHYRGNDGIDLLPQGASLEFSKHFGVVQHELDPDAFVERIQNDADTLDHETAKEIERHPDKKEAKEEYLRAFQKDAAELIDFVSKDSLRPSHLDSANTQTAGWVFFSTQSKWLSGWKKQEEFLFRIPLGGKLFEFPFKLPPEPGEVLLRKRE